MKRLEESSSDSSESDPDGDEDLIMKIELKGKAKAEAAAKAEEEAKAKAKAKAEAEAAATKSRAKAEATAPKSEIEATAPLKSSKRKRRKKKKKKKRNTESDKEDHTESKKTKMSSEGMNTKTDLELYLSGVNPDHLIMNKDASFELTTQWPWTIRAIKRELDYVLQPKELKVHGLFKLKGKKGPPMMTEEDIDTIQQTIENMDLNAQSCMDDYWPSLVKNFSSIQLWTHEYVKHGRPSGMTVEDYFALTLLYYHRLTNKLKFKTNREYTIDDFIRKLKKHATKNMNSNHTPNLSCVESTTLRCMRKEGGDLESLVLKCLSTCIERKRNGMIFVSSTKENRWRTPTQRKRKMIIPYKRVRASYAARGKEDYEE